MRNIEIFGRRVVSAAIDFFIIVVVLYVLSGVMLTHIGSEIDQQAAPFIILSVIFSPLSTLYTMIRTPNVYGNAGIYYGVYVMFLAVEVIYYSVQEILFGQTIGYKALGITIETSAHKRPSVFSIIVRNLLKTISRYLYGIPFLIGIIHNRTPYDLVTGVYVASADSALAE